MRRVASSSEFFDILDKIGNGKFVTIGYVTGANLDVPTVSRRNPATNRMKKYPDYTVFGGEEEEIGALVKITSYNMRYLNRTTVGQKYGKFKASANDIRTNFGIDPIADKTSYKQGTNWSPNGPEIYNGQNADLQSHSYNPQNIFGVKPKGVVYAINKEGHIIKELSPEQVRPYLKAKREIDGVAALRKMGAEEERIQDYINQINNLKFKYINFESNSILWIAATINGEKIVYINDNLYRAVDGIDINPQDFRAIARERYQIDLNNLQEMTKKTMGKNILRLTETDLHRMVIESAKRVLKEMGRYDSDLDADEIYGDRVDREYRQSIADKLHQEEWEMRNRRLREKYPGKSQEWYEAMIDTFYENKKSKKTIKEETFQNNQGYSHFAVNKATNKIVNGWDYSEYDPSELRQFKKDYFDADMVDYGFNPKDYKIVTGKFLLRQGIDPNDNNNWANS
jgi:hypothetical protein